MLAGPVGPAGFARFAAGRAVLLGVGIPADAPLRLAPLSDGPLLALAGTRLDAAGPAALEPAPALANLIALRIPVVMASVARSASRTQRPWAADGGRGGGDRT